LCLYFWNFIDYHSELAGGFTWHVAQQVAGLITGIGVVFLLSASYFFANRTLFARFGKKVEEGFAKTQSPRKRWIILGKARESLRYPQRADSYVVFPVRSKPVPETEGSKLKQLIKTLNQHHGKLITLQVITFLFIATLGLLESRPLFQIPAGASLMLLISLIIMFMGAMSFWFRRANYMSFAVVVLVGYFWYSGSFINGENPAHGLDYSVAPVSYSYEDLDSLHRSANLSADEAYHLAALDQWKAQYQAKYGSHSKPKAVFVTASGGGLRSAFWTFRVMQHLDSLTQGLISDEIRLMAGASGGMFGLTYYRELSRLRAKGQPINIPHKQYGDNISKDLLNRVFFRKLTGLLLPDQQVKVGDFTYLKDTGFAFDQQLARNLPELYGKTIGSYQAAEAAGEIPIVVLEPTIINQGRKLYISASPVSFLSQPNAITHSIASRSSGVEFRRMFAAHQADSLMMSTALRMNASFPYILPIVELPSKPAMQVMDAGAIDNYGTQTTLKYFFQFREWFAEHTERVVFIQIRDHNLEDPIQASTPGMLSQLTTPLGGGYYSMIKAKDLSNDYLLEQVKEWYEGEVDVVPVAYARNGKKGRASLSLHLTQREKQDIEAYLHAGSSQRTFALIQELFKPDYLAQKK
ncbi:MAG: patatin-like phospholipase family protein, partial [Bacteroidota bacterium]